MRTGPPIGSPLGAIGCVAAAVTASLPVSLFLAFTVAYGRGEGGWPTLSDTAIVALAITALASPIVISIAVVALATHARLRRLVVGAGVAVSAAYVLAFVGYGLSHYH